MTWDEKGLSQVPGPSHRTPGYIETPLQQLSQLMRMLPCIPDNQVTHFGMARSVLPVTTTASPAEGTQIGHREPLL